jgi:Right handed beta helix region/Protein of unknown function (DUF1565)
MPTYFVDNVSGNDQNAGDQARPFATIAKAVARAAAGDTIKVVPTARAYTDRFSATASGTAANRITITSTTTVKPKITPSSSWVFTGDYWTVESMDFDGYGARPIQIGGSPSAGLGPDNDFADHIIVQDCTFQHGTQEVWVCHTTDTLIQRCTFRDICKRAAGADCSALGIYGGGGIVVSDCVFEDIGSDGVHIGPWFHQIDAVTVRGCTFRVNRPYGSQTWQNFSSNVGENAIDIKGLWSSPSDPDLVGPVLITGCTISGFLAAVSGQDCSNSAGDLGAGIVIHMDAKPVTIEKTEIFDCDIGVLGSNGSGKTYNFTMTNCTLRGLATGIVLYDHAASVAVRNSAITATTAMEVHSSNIEFTGNTIDVTKYIRAAQTGYKETFSANRYLNALPPAEWQSNTDTKKPDTIKPDITPILNDLTAVATGLDTSADNLGQQAALLASKAADIRAIVERLRAV